MWRTRRRRRSSFVSQRQDMNYRESSRADSEYVAKYSCSHLPRHYLPCQDSTSEALFLHAKVCHERNYPDVKNLRRYNDLYCQTSPGHLFVNSPLAVRLLCILASHSAAVRHYDSRRDVTNFRHVEYAGVVLGWPYS